MSKLFQEKGKFTPGHITRQKWKYFGLYNQYQKVKSLTYMVLTRLSEPFDTLEMLKFLYCCCQDVNMQLQNKLSYVHTDTFNLILILSSSWIYDSNRFPGRRFLPFSFRKLLKNIPIMELTQQLSCFFFNHYKTSYSMQLRRGCL